jgi:NAD(P)-dependent dehydrogenase (short-subunit alcohol dehydrogenase family)
MTLAVRGMWMDLSGRRAFVTGAGGGIGFQIAHDLVAAGCSVTALDIKPDPGDFPSGPGEISYIQGDLCEHETIDRSVDRAATDGLDYVVNAAGVAMLNEDGSIVDIELDVWERTMQINLLAPVHIARRAVPHMLRGKGGAFVHIASVAGARSMDNVLEHGPLDSYQVSKAALISLSRGLALTYGRQGIRSNTICPGAVWTPMTAAIYRDPERIKAMEQRTPLPMVGSPQHIADACLFLLSERAAFITGTDLMVDGGLMAKLV